MSPAEFDEDLVRSQAAVSAAADSDVVGYRAPEWSMRPHTLWALSVLRKRGILYDSSMVPLTRMGDRSFPRGPCRFEHAAWRDRGVSVDNGSMFRRKYPVLGRVTPEVDPLLLHPVADPSSEPRPGNPALVYVHPWEFDLEQPRITLPWSRRFMHYFNLPATPRKLSGLLTHFRFAPIREVLVT